MKGRPGMSGRQRPITRRKAEGMGRNGRPIRGLKTGQHHAGQLVHGLSALETFLKHNRLFDLDGRLGLVKRAKALEQAWSAHCADDPTMTEETAIDRLVPLILMVKGREAAFYRTGKPVDDRYFTEVNLLLKCLAVMPKARRPKDVTALSTLLAQAAADDEGDPR